MLGLRFTSKGVIALTPLLLGWALVEGRLDIQPESRLWVEGTSTVRPFRCAADVIEADVATTRADAASALFTGEKAVGAVALRIPAARLDCRNGTMNSHMLKALKADANPTIAFELASYDLLQTADRVHTTLTGTLTLGGARKDVTIEADLVEEAPGTLRVKGSYPLRMTEFGLKPPSLMLGTMRVNELVTVNFDLVLRD